MFTKQIFIVGAQRSGSSYLYQMLAEHPQVSMALPARPEPKFFCNSDLVAKGIDFYESTYFKTKRKESLVTGEKSTSYIESIEAAKNIKLFYPEAQILMIFRDPVIRAYSNYCFSLENKIETLTFPEALAAENDRLRDRNFSTSVNPYAYRTRGYYIEYLKEYCKVFDESQIKILIFEEFVSNLIEIQALYKQLGLIWDFSPKDFKKPINFSSKNPKQQDTTFKELALGYKDSINELESFLGRNINSWRNNHKMYSV